jgi:hypothetical protein
VLHLLTEEFCTTLSACLVLAHKQGQEKASIYKPTNSKNGHNSITKIMSFSQHKRNTRFYPCTLAGAAYVQGTPLSAPSPFGRPMPDLGVAWFMIRIQCFCLHNTSLNLIQQAANRKGKHLPGFLKSLSTVVDLGAYNRLAHASSIRTVTVRLQEDEQKFEAYTNKRHHNSMMQPYSGMDGDCIRTNSIQQLFCLCWRNVMLWRG